jgi:hypothetical protein
MLICVNFQNFSMVTPEMSKFTYEANRDQDVHLESITDMNAKQEIFDNYRISAIPITILLAPGGKVLKINPTLKEIEAEIIK